MDFSILEWYNKMNEGEIILAYKGEVSSDLITDVLEMIESKLDDSDENSKIRKRIYNVIVECLQNVYHHSEKVHSKNDIVINGKFLVFIVSKEGESYKISTGNFVNNSKIEFLSNRMDRINSLTKDELKSLYKLILNNQDFTDKGGGGLGMIDIARKTGSKLDYKFHNYADNISFFSLNILVS
ncbi:MAG: SiaB family protein kinase [Bacteroidales bacterium]|nr:SiaB family protein kinase [Bacteroidales bacterium]